MPQSRRRKGFSSASIPSSHGKCKEVRVILGKAFLRLEFKERDFRGRAGCAWIFGSTYRSAGKYLLKINLIGNNHIPINRIWEKAYLNDSRGKGSPADDSLLQQCGWIVQDRSELNLSAGTGVAIREGVLKTAESGYLLFAASKAIGTIECQAGRLHVNRH
jgi:hypothetical protein